MAGRARAVHVAAALVAAALLLYRPTCVGNGRATVDRGYRWLWEQGPFTTDSAKLLCELGVLAAVAFALDRLGTGKKA